MRGTAIRPTFCFADITSWPPQAKSTNPHVLLQEPMHCNRKVNGRICATSLARRLRSQIIHSHRVCRRFGDDRKVGWLIGRLVGWLGFCWKSPASSATLWSVGPADACLHPRCSRCLHRCISTDYALYRRTRSVVMHYACPMRLMILRLGLFGEFQARQGASNISPSSQVNYDN